VDGCADKESRAVFSAVYHVHGHVHPGVGIQPRNRNIYSGPLSGRYGDITYFKWFAHQTWPRSALSPVPGSAGPGVFLDIPSPLKRMNAETDPQNPIEAIRFLKKGVKGRGAGTCVDLGFYGRDAKIGKCQPLLPADDGVTGRRFILFFSLSFHDFLFFLTEVSEQGTTLLPRLRLEEGAPSVQQML